MKRLEKIKRKLDTERFSDISLDDIKWLVEQLAIFEIRIQKFEGNWKPIRVDSSKVDTLFDKGSWIGAIAEFLTKKSYTYNVDTRHLAALWDRQSGKCALCGDKLVMDTKLTHLDHKIPKSKGGKDEIDNFQFTCEHCNYAKRDLDTKTFVALCLKISDYNIHLLSGSERAKVFENRWRDEAKIIHAQKQKDKNFKLVKRARLINSDIT